MPARKARDAARADLAAIGDEAPDRGQILVVDVIDRDLRVLAGAVAIEGAAAPAATWCGSCHLAALLGDVDEAVHWSGDDRDRAKGADSACRSRGEAVAIEPSDMQQRESIA